MQILKDTIKTIYPLKFLIEIHKIWVKESNKLLGILLIEILKIRFNKFKDNKTIL